MAFSSIAAPMSGGSTGVTPSAETPARARFLTNSWTLGPFPPHVGKESTTTCLALSRTGMAIAIDAAVSELLFQAMQMISPNERGGKGGATTTDATLKQ